MLVLSIDAWNEPDGWTWNAHYKVGSVAPEVVATLTTPRRVLAWARREGYLTKASKGRCRVDMGACYADTLIEIQDKRTGEPLLAISDIH